MSCIRYESSPWWPTTVPGTHFGPERKFFAISKSPTANRRFWACQSWYLFRCNCLSFTWDSRSGQSKSNRVRNSRLRNRALGETLVVPWTELLYVVRKLLRWCGRDRPDDRLAFRPCFRECTNLSANPLGRLMVGCTLRMFNCVDRHIYGKVLCCELSAIIGHNPFRYSKHRKHLCLRHQLCLQQTVSQHGCT